MALSMRVNKNIVRMEYAVRGPIPQRAAELAAEGRRTIACNIGNPQALGQKPMTFYREVLSLLEAPFGRERERALRRILALQPAVCEGVTAGDLVSEQALAVADEFLTQLPSGLGAYTESKGPAFIRRAVADFIDKRDGVTAESGVRADPELIFLTNGASEAVKSIVDIIISDPTDGIMIPIPQYPLYSAAICRAGGEQVGYYPDEDSGWTLQRPILDEAMARALARGVKVKAIVVINPANPTGAVLPPESGREVVDFAEEYGIAIIADEVYQENLYGAEFVSFARLIGERDIPLFSLHSTSKGFYGECGRRGGYVELRNPAAIAGENKNFSDILLKQASVSLCANTTGQALVYLMVKPPPKGCDAFEKFVREKNDILDALHDKATIIRRAFEEMEGVECFGRTGALYLFPRIEKLPPGKTDFDYCMSLLETTGLCTVNGSGFGQKSGTQHLRIAFLPPAELLEQVLPEWIAFHDDYLNGRVG